MDVDIVDVLIDFCRSHKGAIDSDELYKFLIAYKHRGAR